MGEKQRRTSAVNRRQFVKLAGAGATVGLTGYTGRQDGGQDTVKVGAIYPLSGAVGETGTRIQQVVNSAAEDIINSEQPNLEPLALASEAGLPGLGGAEVEVVWADHRGDPGQGRAEAERMVQEENVDLLYGAYHSSVSKTISQVAEREQVPHVTGESSSPDLTERGLEWFWRVGPHDQIFTENMFEFFDGLNENQDAGLETVAIIHEDTEFGSVSANVQEELCNEHGYEIVAGPISYTAESITSFSSEIGRIREADPDILLPTSYVRDAVLMAEAMREQDFMPDIVMGQNAGHNDPGFVEETELSNNFCSRSTFADDMTESVPEIGRYNDFVTEQTGISFNGVFIRSWGGFITAMKGVDNAGSTEPDAIREGLNSLTMDRLETGLPFGVEFQDNGQNGEASGVLVQFHDGASRLVWPFDLASDDAFTFPAPTWSER
ncbi:ABC transporter substrate-binding protein [Halorussus salinisoli]|uniref:ABC transporter substrate-binding protein n=1 Tax=Halorussus salinisoli TaxID=2558242 RepID=UPI001485B56B|nr:ABC transporter substrate-binding protein [Halorussus salinisoli]